MEDCREVNVIKGIRKKGEIDNIEAITHGKHAKRHNIYVPKEKYYAMKRQRDELLEAAKKATKHLELFADQNDIGEFPDLENLYEVIRRQKEDKHD